MGEGFRLAFALCRDAFTRMCESRGGTFGVRSSLLVHSRMRACSLKILKVIRHSLSVQINLDRLVIQVIA
jgi:hypothetical protein